MIRRARDRKTCKDLEDLSSRTSINLSITAVKYIAIFSVACSFHIRLIWNLIKMFPCESPGINKKNHNFWNWNLRTKLIFNSYTLTTLILIYYIVCLKHPDIFTRNVCKNKFKCVYKINEIKKARHLCLKLWWIIYSSSNLTSWVTWKFFSFSFINIYPRE